MLKVVGYFPDYQFVIAGAPSVKPEFYTELISGTSVSVINGQTYDLLRHAAAALVTSGTATLETALMGIPQVVCYKGSVLSYWVARWVVKVKYISLVNLIMDHQVISELIQDNLSEQSLKVELKKILEVTKRQKIMIAYSALKEKLGGRGASARAASLVTQYLSKN
jgi:lipid-A-disaccharide synthase